MSHFNDWYESGERYQTSKREEAEIAFNAALALAGRICLEKYEHLPTDSKKRTVANELFDDIMCHHTGKTK